MSAGQQIIDGFLKPAGFQRVSSVDGGTGMLTPPDGVKLTLIQAESQDVRWRDDGEAPTDSVGMLLEAGQTLYYNGDPLAFRAIQVTATALLNVSFYT